MSAVQVSTCRRSEVALRAHPYLFVCMQRFWSLVANLGSFFHAWELGSGAGSGPGSGAGLCERSVCRRHQMPFCASSGCGAGQLEAAPQPDPAVIKETTKRRRRCEEQADEPGGGATSQRGDTCFQSASRWFCLRRGRSESLQNSELCAPPPEAPRRRRRDVTFWRRTSSRNQLTGNKKSIFLF